MAEPRRGAPAPKKPEEGKPDDTATYAGVLALLVLALILLIVWAKKDHIFRAPASPTPIVAPEPVPRLAPSLPPQTPSPAKIDAPDDAGGGRDAPQAAPEPPKVEPAPAPKALQPAPRARQAARRRAPLHHLRAARKPCPCRCDDWWPWGDKPK